MSATILQFQPRSRSGDPDFPGIDELAAFHVSSSSSGEAHSAALFANILTSDGGKPRIFRKPADDLTMDRADPEDTAPCEYAPDQDSA